MNNWFFNPCLSSVVFLYTVEKRFPCWKSLRQQLIDASCKLIHGSAPASCVASGLDRSGRYWSGGVWTGQGRAVRFWSGFHLIYMILKASIKLEAEPWRPNADASKVNRLIWIQWKWCESMKNSHLHSYSVQVLGSGEGGDRQGGNRIVWEIFPKSKSGAKTIREERHTVNPPGGNWSAPFKKNKSSSSVIKSRLNNFFIMKNDLSY